MSNEKTKLAKLVESEDGKLMELSKIDNFLQVLNLDPNPAWVKEHPTARGVKYLPVDKVELLLTKIFQHWRLEVLREGQMLNSIYCTVRLHYKNPVTDEWEFQDGVGAAPIQTDAGKSAADMAAIKNDAIMKALPSAESYALKDAAEKLGRVFGKDLNRKDTLGFTPSYKTDEDSPTSILDKFKQAKTEEDINTLLNSLSVENQKAFTQVAQNRLKEIRHAAHK